MDKCAEKDSSNTGRGAFGAAVILAAMGLAANAASIAIDDVKQHWPWSNSVDITYTVTDGDGCFDARVGRVCIKSVVNGVEYVAYDGISSPGRHTVAWRNPPQGVKCDDCRMSAELFLSDPVPPGDDYMVVDLVTGAVTYEGLFDCDDGDLCFRPLNPRVESTEGMVWRKSMPTKQTQIFLDTLKQVCDEYVERNGRS